jgi:hypothetical protein
VYVPSGNETAPYILSLTKLYVIGILVVAIVNEEAPINALIYAPVLLSILAT